MTERQVTHYDSETPRTDANLAATDAYNKRFMEAAKGPWGVTVKCPDPDAPPSLSALCRTLERELAEGDARICRALGMETVSHAEALNVIDGLRLSLSHTQPAQEGK